MIQQGKKICRIVGVAGVQTRKDLASIFHFVGVYFFALEVAYVQRTEWILPSQSQVGEIR